MESRPCPPFPPHYRVLVHTQLTSRGLLVPHLTKPFLNCVQTSFTPVVVSSIQDEVHTSKPGVTALLHLAPVRLALSPSSKPILNKASPFTVPAQGATSAISQFCSCLSSYSLSTIDRHPAHLTSPACSSQAFSDTHLSYCRFHSKCNSCEQHSAAESTTVWENTSTIFKFNFYLKPFTFSLFMFGLAPNLDE